MNEDFLRKKLDQRKAEDAYRALRPAGRGIDFCSNDYLGIATNQILKGVKLEDEDSQKKLHGSTGSRLMSGNYTLIEKVEKQVARYHNAHAGLFFNSGYSANLGLLSCIAERNDTFLYDQLCHASTKDGIRLSNAKAFSFRHNDVNNLRQKIAKAEGNIFVVTESLFSMDGDLAPLKEMSEVCQEYGANLIVDEAHATGIIGAKGEGLVQSLGLADKCFARIHTFGKAIACHGAIVLGSEMLRDYLINFSRSFIYTTAMPALNTLTIGTVYTLLPAFDKERAHLAMLSQLFNELLQEGRVPGETPIKAVFVPGNEQCKRVAGKMQALGFDVLPVLAPTVAAGSERLRVVLHAFNTVDDVTRFSRCLSSELELVHINQI